VSGVEYPCPCCASPPATSPLPPYRNRGGFYVVFSSHADPWPKLCPWQHSLCCPCCCGRSLGRSFAGSREVAGLRNLRAISLHVYKRVTEFKQTKEKLLQLTEQCWLVPLGTTAPGSLNITFLLDLNGNPHALGILTRKVFIMAEVSSLPL